MREAARQELDRAEDQLAGMLRLVWSALTLGTTALFDEDPAVAERSTLAAEKALQALRRELDEHASGLLAPDRIGITELRAVVAGVVISTDLECMADLAQDVVDTARVRAEKPPLPAPATLHGMGQLAMEAAVRAGNALKSADFPSSKELAGEERETYRLQRKLYQQLLSRRGGTTDVRTAVDVTLVGRCYEQFVHHALSVIRHAALLVGGQRADVTAT